jgi:hypothetical protein
LSGAFFIFYKNKIMILALDISTSCIGYSLFNEDGDELMELNYVKFRSKISLFEKRLEFKKQIKFLENSNIQHIVIEEPLKKFKGKFSSADTIALLNFFNGMISGTVHEMFGVEPIHYNVNTARKIAFPDFKPLKDSASNKHAIFTLVRDREPHIVWKYGPKSSKLVDENFDMCDSYVIGLCHINIMKEQAGVN